MSDTVLSLNMYECFMNTKYLCSCLKRYHTNLSLINKASSKGVTIKNSHVFLYWWKRAWWCSGKHTCLLSLRSEVRTGDARSTGQVAIYVY